MFRRVGYSFSLRLLLRLGLGGLRLRASCPDLITSVFSLLLLKLTRLPLRFPIASCGGGASPGSFLVVAGIPFLFAAVLCLLRFLAIFFAISVVSNLELLISGTVGNTFHVHRLSQVLHG